MNNRSRSTLFLIEQLIVIAVFAICAVACISILTAAFSYAGDTKATAHALIAAESGAEVFKATGGDINTVADIIGGTTGASGSGTAAIKVFYDNSWQVSGETDASFVLDLLVDAPGNSNDVDLITAELTVSKMTGEQLVAFPLAVLRN